MPEQAPVRWVRILGNHIRHAVEEESGGKVRVMCGATFLQMWIRDDEPDGGRHCKRCDQALARWEEAGR